MTGPGGCKEMDLLVLGCLVTLLVTDCPASTRRKQYTSPWSETSHLQVNADTNSSFLGLLSRGRGGVKMDCSRDIYTPTSHPNPI